MASLKLTKYLFVVVQTFVQKQYKKMLDEKNE